MRHGVVNVLLLWVNLRIKLIHTVIKRLNTFKVWYKLFVWKHFDQLGIQLSAVTISF